jgi:hypothetical protein
MILDPAQAALWLGEAGGHVPVPLRRRDTARLLWLNTAAAAAIDPAWARLGRSADAYAGHLMERCAWTVCGPGEPAQAIGDADRYGGSGIGHNGGSGRAVVFDGYHLKGVGRTPLVSAGTPRSHAAGGAYLEEAVRETVFAEIVGQRFPHSAVPTLALIDLGEVQDWRTDWSPRRERRVLLVRPAALRPAHFERAAGAVSAAPEAAQADCRRVEAMFALALAQWGADDLLQRFQRLWRRWAEQLAFGFVHRITHGNHTSSNIALDGRLLDFGASSALPTWAPCATTRQPQGWGSGLGALCEAIRSHAHHLARHVDPRLDDAGTVHAWQHQARAGFQQGLCESFLGAVTEPGELTRLDGREVTRALWPLLHRVLRHFDAEPGVDMLESTPQPRRVLDLARFWDADPPSHWLALQAAVRALGCLPRPMVADEADWRRLCFPELKRALFAALDGSENDGPAPTAEAVGRVLSEHVACGLRQLPARPVPVRA